MNLPTSECSRPVKSGFEETIVKIRAMRSKNKEIHVDVYGGQQWNQIICVKMLKLVTKLHTDTEFDIIASDVEMGG